MNDLEMMRRALACVEYRNPGATDLCEALATRVQELEAAETDSPKPTPTEQLLAMGDRVGRLMDRVDELHRDRRSADAEIARLQAIEAGAKREEPGTSQARIPYLEGRIDALDEEVKRIIESFNLLAEWSSRLVRWCETHELPATPPRPYFVMPKQEKPSAEPS